MSCSVMCLSLTATCHHTSATCHKYSVQSMTSYARCLLLLGSCLPTCYRIIMIAMFTFIQGKWFTSIEWLRCASQMHKIISKNDNTNNKEWHMLNKWVSVPVLFTVVTWLLDSSFIPTVFIDICWMRECNMSDLSCRITISVRQMLAS